MSVTVEINRASLKKIQKRLGDMSDKAPIVIRNALNDTAKKAEKKLAKKAQETYAVKTGSFTGAGTLKRATRGKLEAEIHYSGSTIQLKKFKVSPAGFRTGSSRPEMVKAKVLKSSGMKELVKGDIKAFVAKIQNEHMKKAHIGVMQRIGKERLPIKGLYSNSIPKMIGNEEHVYGVIRPEIGSDLQEAVNKQIQKVLGGYI